MIMLHIENQNVGNKQVRNIHIVHKPNIIGNRENVYTFVVSPNDFSYLNVMGNYFSKHVPEIFIYYTEPYTELCTQLYNILMNLKNGNPQKDQFKNKYLKYKQKYLNLKKK